MFGTTVFGIFFSIMINFYSVSTGHWIYSISTVEPRIINNVNITSNETDFFEELMENNIPSTTENDVLFWTKPDENGIMEDNPGVKKESDKLNKEVENISTTFQPSKDNAEKEINVITPGNVSSTDAIKVAMQEDPGVMQDNNEGSKPVNQSNITQKNDTEYPNPEITQSKNVTNNDDKADFTSEITQNNNVTYNYTTQMPNLMDEKIILQRNNCHLEIAIQETHDLKIEIKFGKLQNNTSGKCCITLNGQENAQLGVLISNIHLHQNGSEGEVLKVITADYGSEFVLKEYHSRTSYQPLLLTETQRVYIVLYYKVGDVPPNEQGSHFNLEVFSYHRYGNYINHGTSYTESHFPYQNGAENLPMDDPYFAPYYYYNY